MRRALWGIALIAQSACLEADAVRCANGVLCPAGSQCDEQTGGCLLPFPCFGIEEGSPNGAVCGVGPCQRPALCISGVEVCEPGQPEATDVPDDEFIDSNCDGFDGLAGVGLFVAEDGDDNGPGSLEQPLATIGAAIDSAEPGTTIHVSTGAYVETLVLRSDISIHGGYSRGDGWARRDEFVTTVRGGSIAIECSGQTDIVLDHLVVRSERATVPGGSSYAVHMVDCERVSLNRMQLVAAEGADGVNGVTGAAGADGETGDAGTGGGCEIPSAGQGGSGGHAGGTGGFSGRFDSPGQAGTAGEGPEGVAGAPGLGATCSRATAGLCGELAACHNGQPGQSGGDGQDGDNGAGGPAFNLQSALAYVAADGVAGDPGTAGGGGGAGGGGAGGRRNILTSSPCPGVGDDGTWGTAGAGGGGGGAGGDGGAGGGGGGGSFALWVHGGGDVAITQSTFETERGGRGGAGGIGGLGGAGGPAGFGYRYVSAQNTAGCGGPGGNGANGGRGGAGGGGGGGPSVGIVFSDCEACTEADSNFIVRAGGIGGSGGFPGESGREAELLAF